VAERERLEKAAENIEKMNLKYEEQFDQLL
jgi:hypothetical protein